MKAQISYPSCFREGQKSAHSFSGRGKCPHLFLQGEANVLHLVLARANVGGEGMYGGNVIHSAYPYSKITHDRWKTGADTTGKHRRQ